MEILQGIVYVFASIVMLFIGPIYMIVIPNRNDEQVKTYTEKEGCRHKIAFDKILEIGSILVLLDLWK